MAKDKTANKSRHYKMVFLRSDDLQEVRSIDLSITGIYVLLSSLFIIIGSVIWATAAYTPLRQLIPGYGQVQSNDEVLKLIKSLEDMEVSIEERQTYLNAFRTIITGGQGDTDLLKNIELNPVVNLQTPSYTGGGSAQSQDGQLTGSSRIDLLKVLSFSPHIIPVSGIVSSPYDPSKKHFGIDFIAPANTAVKAFMDGYVIMDGWDIETGYIIGIQHEANILSFYKHNSQLLKEKGNFVRAGEAIAIIGNTGTLSTGPHLHFELWHNGISINPSDYLKL